MEGRAWSGRLGALLRSCPPAPSFGRRLLLYFAAQSAPPSWSGTALAVRLRTPRQFQGQGHRVAAV